MVTTTFAPGGNNPAVTLSNGNLTVTQTSGTAGVWHPARALYPLSSGRYYVEMTINNNTGATGIEPINFGLMNATHTVADNEYLGNDLNSIGYFENNFTFRTNGVSTVSGTAAGANTNIIGFGIDLDAKYITFRGATFALSPIFLGNLLALNAGPYALGVALTRGGNQVTVNFGATAFSGPVPAEFGSGWASSLAAVPCQWSAISNNLVTLSGAGNTIATTAGPANTSFHAVQATTFKATGKWYYEISIGNQLASGRLVIGVASPYGTFTGALAASVGSDLTSVGYYSNGTVRSNNATLATLTATANGNVISVATDLDNKRIWFRIGAGNWNNNALANPATNVGGLDISTMVLAGYRYAPKVAGFDGPGNQHVQVTARFATASFTQSVPAGFAEWGNSDANPAGPTDTPFVQSVFDVPRGRISNDLRGWINQSSAIQVPALQPPLSEWAIPRGGISYNLRGWINQAAVRQATIYPPFVHDWAAPWGYPPNHLRGWVNQAAALTQVPAATNTLTFNWWSVPEPVRTNNLYGAVRTSRQLEPSLVISGIEELIIGYSRR